MAENVRQRIIAVIGKRYAGKSTAVQCIRRMVPGVAVLDMNSYAVAAFINLHAISWEEFCGKQNDGTINKQLANQYRHLFGIYMEAQRKKDPTVFLEPFFRYIKTLEFVVIDNVFYFNWLQELIKMNAEILLIEADDNLRKERGGGHLPTDDLLDYEVSSLTSGLVKTWPRTHYVTNNKKIEELGHSLYRYV